MSTKRRNWRRLGHIAIATLVAVSALAAPVQAADPLAVDIQPDVQQDAIVAETAGQSTSGQSTSGSGVGAVSSTNGDVVTLTLPQRQGARRMPSAAELAAAVPLDIPTRQGAETSPRLASGPTGPAGTFDGGNPARLPSLEGGGLLAPLRVSSSAEPQHTGVYPPHQVLWKWFGRYRTYPISTIGKLFIDTDGNGTFNSVCSASTASPDMYWTAGHCLAPGNGTWYADWLFCPSYDASQGGVNPQVGCWDWSSASVNGNWFATGDLDSDFGAVSTAASGGAGACAGARLHNCTGWLGFAWNFSRDQSWAAFGYPQGAPFDGGFIITAIGEWWSNQNGGPGVDSVSMGNRMTGGSSGGPWIKGDSFGRTCAGGVCPGNYINGHNDWRWISPNHSQAMNSPYFDDRARSVFCAQSESC